MGDENLTERLQCLWATADVSKGHTPVDEFSRLFNIRILFQVLLIRYKRKTLLV